MNIKAIDELALFKRYQTREQYTREVGEQPPVFRTDIPVKYWFDPAHKGSTSLDPVEYTVFDWNTKSIRQERMEKRLAGTVNIPGTHTWPKYDPPETPAMVVSSVFDPYPYNKFYLSSFQEALDLAKEIESQTGVKFAVEEQTYIGGMIWIDYKTETRRTFVLAGQNGSKYNVGLLLQAKNAYGVGRPGGWSVSGSGPVWTPAYLVEYPVPGQKSISFVPIRPLEDNERLVVTPFSAYIAEQQSLSELIDSVITQLEQLKEALVAQR